MMKSERKTKLNNQGISLVEVLVVIGIMAILIGGVTMGFAVITNSYAREAATYVTDALGMVRTKATSITADEWNVTFAKESATSEYVISVNRIISEVGEGGTTTTKTEVVESYRIDSDIVITYIHDSADSEAAHKLQISDTNAPLVIKFNVGQGSVEGIYYTDAQVNANTTWGASPSGISSIVIQSGSFSRTIELYHTTGKYDIIDD